MAHSKKQQQEQQRKKKQQDARHMNPHSKTTYSEDEAGRSDKNKRKEKTGFGTFPRRALTTPTKRSRGTVLSSQRRRSFLKRQNGEARRNMKAKRNYTQKHSELARSSGSAEQETTTQETTRTRNALSSICNKDLIESDDLRSANLLNILREQFLEKGAQALVNCLSELPGKTVGPTIRKPQCFRLNFLSAISELENDSGEVFLQNLHKGATIGYNECLGTCPEVFPGKTKQRVYDDQRNFLGNYKNGLR